MFWKATGRLNCFPPASSRGHLVSNSQHAAFLYEKVEFGHWEGRKENGGGEELTILQGQGGERRMPRESS